MPDTHQPYVGVSSFAHKAGLHASALKVSADLYNHVDAAVVGNDMRVLVTEMAGRASVELKGRELGYDLSSDREAVGRVVERVKDLESQGWTFEAADASFELLLREETGATVTAPFVVESWRTIVEQRADGVVVSEATVKLRAGEASRPSDQHPRGQRPGQRARQRACALRWSRRSRSSRTSSSSTTRSASSRATKAQAP